MKLLKWQIFLSIKEKLLLNSKKVKNTEAIQTSNDALKEAKDMDISILVNEGSASASEMFTGALKDYNKAKVYRVKKHSAKVSYKLQESLRMVHC